jgi:anti-anti-sigma factor
MPLEIQQTPVDGAHILALGGQLDSRTAPELERELLDCLAKDRKLILLDLAKLEFVSSAGLRVMVMVGKRLSAAGGALALCALNPSVQQVFDVAGFTRLFAIQPSREAALGHLVKSSKLTRVSQLASSLLRQEAQAPAAPRPASADAALRSERASLAAELLSGRLVAERARGDAASAPAPVDAAPARPTPVAPAPVVAASASDAEGTGGQLLGKLKRALLGKTGTAEDR